MIRIPAVHSPSRPGTLLRGSALAALFLLAPLPVLAQVCLGSPTAPGQFALTGDANITESTNDFGVGIEANIPGPLGLRAGVSMEEDASDERVARFEGRVSYDIRSNGVSICPVTGADFTSRSVDEVTARRIRVPVGLSVGGRIPLSEGGPSLIPSARAGLAHHRFTTSGIGESLTETENSFFAVGGGSIALDEFFVRGEAGFDSADHIDPTFSVSVGVRF